MHMSMATRMKGMRTRKAKITVTAQRGLTAVT
jgi:hypothetical protein